MKIIKDGNLPYWLRTALSLGGAAIIFLSLVFIDQKPLMWIVAFLGLAIGSIGFYCAQAAMLRIRPFERDLSGPSNTKGASDDVSDGSQGVDDSKF